MAAKDIKNLIATIIIAIIGVHLLIYISKVYIPQIGQSLPGMEIFSSIEGISNLITIVLVIIILFLLPFYFSKKSGEKKTR
ncbi:MAG: hypothetical protein J4469_00660 [Candidatus Aenigmarchaeota archaeon]|nr:hypothetical protein [Candidatus Aenigmarchaeota archaeon]